MSNGKLMSNVFLANDLANRARWVNVGQAEVGSLSVLFVLTLLQ